MNREIKNHLQYKWWAYLLIAVVVVGVWFAVFSILSNPQDNEKVAITFVGNNFDSLTLENDLPEVIKTNSQQLIKSVSVERLYSDNAYTLDTMIVTRAQGSTDIFIWEGELNDGLDDRYASIDENIISSVLGDVTYHKVDGVAYAIKLQDGNFEKYYKGDKECWLLFSLKSVNLGGANGTGTAENDAALQAVKYLMGK